MTGAPVVAILSVLLGSSALWATYCLLVPHLSIRLSLLLAPCLWTSAIIVISEILSAIGVYRRPWLIALLWVASAIVIVVARARRRLAGPQHLAQLALTKAREQNIAGKLALAAMSAVALVTAITGAAVAPNNIDSLSYHLPRIMQWLQNGRVGGFETPYVAQLYLPPGAEFSDALLLVSTGTDRAMFITQWISLLIATGAVIVACRNLGVSSWASLTAGALFITSPLVIGEASTTQTDLCATAFVSVALACVTATGKRPDWWLPTALVPWLAAAAFAVKPTAALFAVPVVVWAVIVAARQHPRRLAGVICVGVLAAAILNCGWMLRNVESYNSPTGPDSGLTVKSDYVTAAASNSVKNLGHNLAVPAPETANSTVSDLLGRASEIISGVRVDDPRFSFTSDYSVDSQRNEDRAANILQFMLTVVALVVICISSRERLLRSWPVVLSLISGYLLFSGIIKYQTWGGRLLLPTLAFGSVLIAVALDSRRPTRWRYGIAITLTVACTAASTPWLIAQKWRPWFGGSSIFVRSSFQDITASMDAGTTTDRKHAIEEIYRLNSCPGIVSLAGHYSYDYEYIWWRYLSCDGDSRINHVASFSDGKSGHSDVIINFGNTPTNHDGYSLITCGNFSMLIKDPQ